MIPLRSLEGLSRDAGAVPASPRIAAGAPPAAFGTVAERRALRERIMNLLVSALASDERLVRPAATLLHGLRPHLLAAARADGGFFADREHPWRQVLAILAQRAMLWPPTHRHGLERFLQPLAACVDELVQHPPGSEAAAARALAALQRDHRRWHDAAKCSRAVTALRAAERRNVVARSVAADLGLRPGFAEAPAVLKHFLVGPWSQVMAAALLRDIGEADPGHHTRTVGDLLWSTRPGAAAQAPTRLASILPRTVVNVRRGLDSIEYPEADTTAFVQWLGVCCPQALPPQARSAHPTALEAARPRQGFGVATASASQPWLTPGEACDVHLLEGAELRAQFPRVPIEGLDLPATALRAAGGLTPGGIVEVCRRGRRERWAVEWASRYGLLFLFCDGAGRLRSLTAPSLASLMRADAARIVCRQPLVDATLDSLAQVAVRASLREPGRSTGDMAPIPRGRQSGATAAAGQEH